MALKSSMRSFDDNNDHKAVDARAGAAHLGFLGELVHPFRGSQEGAPPVSVSPRQVDLLCDARCPKHPQDIKYKEERQWQ